MVQASSLIIVKEILVHNVLGTTGLLVQNVQRSVRYKMNTDTQALRDSVRVKLVWGAVIVECSCNSQRKIGCNVCTRVREL
jgi:hypothetical protein